MGKKGGKGHKEKGYRCVGQEGETVKPGRGLSVAERGVRVRGGRQEQAIKSSVTCCSDSLAFVCGEELRPFTMVDQCAPWGRASAQLADP